MSILLQRSQKRKKLKEGINFVLNDFPRHNVFPRAISTQASSIGPSALIHNKNEILAYEQSDFIGCKVSAYLAFTSEKFIHDSEINIHAPDFVFINMTSKPPSASSSSPTTLSSSANGMVDQIKALFPILQNIKELLYWSKPIILWSCNSFQIYQHLQTITLEYIEEEYLDLEHIEGFRKFVTQQYLLSNLFLEFSTQRLLSYSNGTRLYPLHYTLYKSSSSHYSFLNPSMLIIIAGTVNSKCIGGGKEQEIEMAQAWDGNRPKVDILLANFQTYLKIEKIPRKKGEGGEKTRVCYLFQ